MSDLMRAAGYPSHQASSQLYVRRDRTSGAPRKPSVRNHGSITPAARKPRIFIVAHAPSIPASHIPIGEIVDGILRVEVSYRDKPKSFSTPLIAKEHLGRLEDG
jgi:hypothetical protein